MTVNHKHFREMTVKDLRGIMNEKPVIIDVRGFLDQKEIEKSGVYYKRL